MTDHHTWRKAGQAALLVLLAVVVLVSLARPDTDALAGRLRHLPPLPFFVAMTLLPLAGVPASPFYLLAAAVFSRYLEFPMVGLSIALNLALAYLISRAILRVMPERATQWVARHLPEQRRPNPWLMTLFVRVMPGPTVAMKSYLLGFSGVPPAPYLLLSWPFSMAYAVGLIWIGEAAFQQQSGWLAAGVGLLLLLALGGMLFRRWSRAGNRNPSSSVLPDAVHHEDRITEKN